MVDVVFLNMLKGNRLTAYLNLKMYEGVPYRFPKDYTYIEVPFGDALVLATGDVVTEATRNQRIRVRPACSIELKGQYKAIIKPNPVLHDYGILPPIKLIDPHDGENATFNMTMQKDFDFSKLEWAIRIYMVG